MSSRFSCRVPSWASRCATRDVKGFHQLFILGNLERPLQQFGLLASLDAARIF